MPSGPRSQRLLSWSSTGLGFSPAFVCPADHVTLVKSAFYQNAINAPRTVLLINSHPGGATITVDAVELASAAYGRWDGWIALNPGDAVYCHADGDAVLVTVYGAVLLGGPPFPPAELRQPRVVPEGSPPGPPAGATPSPLSPTRARSARVNKV